MATWTCAPAGFDTEDESIIFGTRAVIDDGNRVFEAVTLATIRPQGEVFFSHFLFVMFLCD
jgi:hypothetical protein